VSFQYQLFIYWHSKKITHQKTCDNTRYLPV